MESVIRDVRDIEPEERHVFETLIGHGLGEDQRILVVLLPLGANRDDFVRRRAREEFFELCKQGTENRERLHVSVEEADLILEEALQSARAGSND
jgi:hypothetical protein